MSAALPDAFHSSGVIVGSAYAVMQIVRSGFAVAGLHGQSRHGAHRNLALNFQRILAWCCVSGALAIAGGFAPAVVPRALLWLGAVVVDFAGGIAGFYTPGLGRTPTREWDIEGGHFAERCQAFLLIALGESIVVTGATFARLLTHDLSHRGPEHVQTVLAFLVAFGGSAAFWWLYFDRSADDAARVIEASADPGRMGRTAYHFIHPIMVGGIILTAAADEIVLSRPGATGAAWTSWLILGGAGLFVAGHLAFKLAVWRRLSWQRVAGLVVLALLGLAAAHVTALVLSACAAATVVAVAAADYVIDPSRAAPTMTARRPEAGR
jgi:low temperature requirement protein LtrA